MGNYQPCSQCAGVGRMKIDLKCNSCKGNGKFPSKIDCDRCNATGKITKEFTSMSASDIQFCSSCQGHSTVDDPCSVCGFSGRLESIKKKTRTIRCGECNGRGKTNRCGDCIARGTIETEVACTGCNGKGKLKRTK